MGKFAIKKTNTGVKFNLKAGNGQVIATSEVYTTLAACKNGIASVQKNAPVANVEDQTEAGFAVAMEEQKQKARDNQNFSAKLTAGADLFEGLSADITSEFVGYDSLTSEATILALASETEAVKTLSAGEAGTIIVGKTPFYATMGGQKGDMGVIRTANGTFEVIETVKLPGDRIGHVGKVLTGALSVDEVATLEVDTLNRNNTCKNHSATHLLQKALKVVLGDHVEQQGSYQDNGRTRFDFSHSQAMSAEEIAKVEQMVNEKIAEDLAVVTEEMSIEDAKNKGAMALFGEKYGASVRVVSMGDFSMELCGGTHVKRTSDIAFFKILSESGVSAGVRRIEALTGANVMAYYKAMEENLAKAVAAAKATPATLTDKIQHMQAEIKALSAENESLKSKAAKDALGDVMSQVVEVKGMKLLATSVDGVDMNGLRDLGDQLKEKLDAEGWKTFQQFTKAQMEASSLSDCDSFISGFRLGAKVIMDVLLTPSVLK